MSGATEHCPPLAALPEPLRRLLLVGGQGTALVAARDLAIASGPQLAGLADRLALAVWEEIPLDGAAVAVLAGRQAARPFLDPATARIVAGLAALIRPAGPDAYFERLAARRDIPRLLAYFLARLAKTPDDPAAAHGLAGMAAMAPDTEAAEAALAALPGPLGRPGLQAAGELALLAGRPELAASRFRAVLDGLPSAAALFRLAQAELALDRRPAAVAALSRLVAARPWDALALGRLHDLAEGLDRLVAPLPGPVAVLLYSYASADRLDRTLAALSSTDWRYAPAGDGARLVVLDNGSPDGTGAVLAAWRDRLGERLATVRLPVNVGAPAARNWLAGHPAVAASAFAAYLDDDALVPPDWLGRLGAAVEAHPGAGVYGCLVRGTGAPRFVQCADSHLWPLARPRPLEGRGFDLVRPWLATADWGQYAIARPCAAVTGCCHLFPTKTLLENGGFDIRFSPSQYDDLDHDLRLLGRGLTPVCTGHLVVAHDKVTGAAGNPGGAAYGSGFANQFKLHHKYDDAAISRAADTAYAALARDTAAKARRLFGARPSPWDLDGEGGRER